jgi:hypothetical protein
MAGEVRWGVGVRGVNEHAATIDADAAVSEEAEGLGVERVLDGEDAGGERVGRVVRVDGHGLLQHDRAGVVRLVDEVDRRAAPLHAVVEGGFVDAAAVEPGPAERRQERRVDVEDAVLKRAHDGGRHVLEIPGERDEVDAVLAQRRQQSFAERLGPVKVLRPDDDARDAVPRRPLQHADPVAVRHDERDLGAERARLHRVEDGLHVRAPARGEGGEAETIR